MIMKGNLTKLSKEKNLGLRKNYFIQTKGLFTEKKGKRNEPTIVEPKFDFTPKHFSKNINTSTPTKIKAGRTLAEDANHHITQRYSSMTDLPAKSYLSNSQAYDTLKSSDRITISAFDQAFSSFKKIRERNTEVKETGSDALLSAAYTRNYYTGTGIFSSHNSRMENRSLQKT